MPQTDLSDEVSQHLTTDGKSSSPRERAAVWACRALLVAGALTIGLYGVSASGPTYPDAPRYANGGAMIHDWLLAGDWLHPYRFALENYRRYPGFSIPYHPPAYPSLLGLVFLVTGVDYVAARAFIAVCFAGS